jgi:hypothetical protein
LTILPALTLSLSAVLYIVKPHWIIDLCLSWPWDCLPFCTFWTLIWITDLCLSLTCRFAYPLF